MNVATPNLRFKGFQGRWQEASLESVSIKNISYGIVQTGEYIDDGVPCIRVVDLTVSVRPTTPSNTIFCI